MYFELINGLNYEIVRSPQKLAAPLMKLKIGIKLSQQQFEVTTAAEEERWGMLLGDYPAIHKQSWF
jgi:hypothetical protein